jgi:hypothetical protein
MLLASERYERGLTDFLNVADAQRQEYDLQGQYALAQMTLAEQFVAVYRALGGGWEQYGEPPPVRAPQPAIVAMFRRLFNPESYPTRFEPGRAICVIPTRYEPGGGGSAAP